jgi:hypothetical protein
MDQHVEHLWLDAEEVAVPMQLAPVTVDLPVFEYEGHVPASTILRTFSGKPPAFVLVATHHPAVTMPDKVTDLLLQLAS